MDEYGLKAKNATVADLGLKNVAAAYWNLTPAELVEETIVNGLGSLTDTGALAVDTGEFTGRSPKDRFVVCDENTENSVWWGDINIKFSQDSTKYKLNQDINKKYANVFTQAEEIADCTIRGDAAATQKIQGDETKKIDN